MVPDRHAEAFHTNPPGRGKASPLISIKVINLVAQTASMARICIACGAEMVYEQRFWRCPRCRAMEEGESPSGNGKQRYRSYRQGGPLRSQKR